MQQYFTQLFTRLILSLGLGLGLAETAWAQSAVWQWGLQSQNATPTDATSANSYAVAVDAQGRSYMGGSYGEYSITPLSATRSFGSAGSIGPGYGAYVACASPNGQWAWVQAITASGSSTHYPPTMVTGLAVTAAGDVYATGFAQGNTVTVGSISETMGLPSGIFVARFNSAGVCQWLRTIGTTLTRPHIAADPSTGGVVIAGDYLIPLVFGNYTLPADTTGANRPLFVARLSATGQWLGAAASTGVGGVTSDVQVAVGPGGQVAVTGSYGEGRMAFGTSTLTAPTGTSESLFIAQLSANNQWDWAVGSANTQWCTGTSLGYTSTGALWVSGRGANGTLLGSTVLAAGGQPGWAFAGFIGQLTPTGQWRLLEQLSPGRPALATIHALAVDGAGNAISVALVDSYGGSVPATMGNLLLTTPVDSRLQLVVRLSSTGQVQQVAAVPASSQTFRLLLSNGCLDAGGNYYVSGYLRGGLHIGNSTLAGTDDGSTSNNTQGDAMLAKLSGAGTPLATRAITPVIALACWPNPAHQRATISWLVPATDPTVIILTDALGRTVRHQLVVARSTTATLNLAGLPAGVYWVRYQTSCQQLVVQ